VSGDPFINTIPFQVLSWEPRAVFYPNFLDPERCAHIVAMAAKRLAPSGLALRAGDTAATTGDIRTSQGTFLMSREDKEGVLDYLEKRIAAVTLLPQRHGEAFNVLRYEVGQKCAAREEEGEARRLTLRAGTTVTTTPSTRSPTARSPASALRPCSSI